MKIEDFIRGIIDEAMENVEIEGIVDINGDAYPTISESAINDIIVNNTDLLKEALTHGLLDEMFDAQELEVIYLALQHEEAMIKKLEGERRPEELLGEVMRLKEKVLNLMKEGEAK